MSEKLYAERDPMALKPHYCRHVMAMTAEQLHWKSDIAAELAFRDKEIERLRAEVERLKTAAVPEGGLPIQPISIDGSGVIRFEVNPLVRHLLDDGPFDLNHLYIWCIENEISEKYQEQFAQLIGYSLWGFGELSYVSDEAYARAEAAAPQPPTAEPKEKPATADGE